MDTYTFSKPVGVGSGDNFSFGIDDVRTVAALRDLADKIERKEIAPQSARVVTLTRIEEFATTVLRLVMVEKRPKTIPQEIKEN